MFDNLLKAAIGVVTLPVDIVADAVTLPQKALDDEEFNTTRKAKAIVDNLHKAAGSD